MQKIQPNEEAMVTQHREMMNAAVPEQATQAEWDTLAPTADALFQAARKSHYAHNKEAEILGLRGRWFGGLATVLATVSGASLLGQITTTVPLFAAHKVATEIVQGLLTISAAVLTALQPKFDHQTRAENHRNVAADYGSIRRKMKIMFSIPLRERDTPRNFLESVEQDLHTLATKSPIISTKVWMETESRLKDDPSDLIRDN